MGEGEQNLLHPMRHALFQHEKLLAASVHSWLKSKASSVTCSRQRQETARKVNVAAKVRLACSRPGSVCSTLPAAYLNCSKHVTGEGAASAPGRCRLVNGQTAAAMTAGDQAQSFAFAHTPSLCICSCTCTVWMHGHLACSMPYHPACAGRHQERHRSRHSSRDRHSSRERERRRERSRERRSRERDRDRDCRRRSRSAARDRTGGCCPLDTPFGERLRHARNTRFRSP